MSFQPGVVTGGNTGGGVNVHGSRDRAFNFTLDGIDINESTAGGSNFTPLRTNPDALQEFQIVTSNSTAELGRSSGAQVTLVTRSGTNQFHGNLFEYYQTPGLNARTYPETIAGSARGQFVQHIFGGSLGGPLFNPGFGEGTKPFSLLKDRAFFFVNLQLLRAYDTALVTRTVYTDLARQGIYRYVVGRANAPAGTSTAAVDLGGNAILPACSATVTTLCIRTYNINANSPTGTGNPSATGLDPTLLAFINAMPTANNFTSGDGLNTAGFNFASPQREKQYDFTTKLDFKIRENSLFYVRYSQGEQNSFGDSGNGGRPVFPNAPNLVDTFRNPKNLAANWRWSPTGSLANEFIFGISKYNFEFGTPEPDPNYPFAFINTSNAYTNFSYNARGVRTLQFIDNVTYIRGSHTMKGGINFRFSRHSDDRASVAGSTIESIVNFGGAAGYTAFNLPSSGATSINATDLTRLQNTINDLLGRISSVSQAFVSDPNNPGVFAPAGTRWLNSATYPELDFYAQDNWRIRKNLVLDLGVRWEVKLSPRVDGRPILIPNQPVKLGATPTNSLKWVEGDVFDNQYNLIEPSIGLAWDPFGSGKTSVRVNYRLASDRFATFLFGSNIFQSAPGNTFGPTNSTFGQSGGLYRNLASLPSLYPTTTPDNLRQPVAFGTSSTSAIDPDLQFPQIHSWSASFQREIWNNNVLEVNYIGKHGVHLLGGYNVNQVRIFDKPTGFNESFLDAFNTLKANTANTSPLINALLTGSSTNNNGSARFRTLVTQNTITQGNVASAALTLSQRTCQSADVTAGVCTNAQIGQRLVNLSGFEYLLQPFPQFTGGINVFDSNDYSWYHGLEIIFKRRISKGLGFQLGYTLSKSQDNRSWDPSLSTVSTGSVQSASSTPFDLRDRGLNYTYSDFDRRHVFQGTYVWELPFGRDRWLGSDMPKALDFIVGGWQLAGTVLWTSGRPFTVYSGLNTVSNVVQSTANCNGCTRDIGNLVLESGRNFWFDAATRALFSPPDPGSIGNTGRNFFIAPTYFQTDASLSKKFKFNERFSFDLRVDAKNVTNTPSFDNPTAVFTSSIFGRINDSVTNTGRRMQLSGKFNF